MNDYQTKHLAGASRQFHHAADITQIISEYMRQMERALKLKVTDLDSS